MACAPRVSSIASHHDFLLAVIAVEIDHADVLRVSFVKLPKNRSGLISASVICEQHFPRFWLGVHHAFQPFE